MFKFLTKDEIDNPGVREIIIKYKTLEINNLDIKVCTPLEKEYTSLKPFSDQLRNQKDKDYISQLDSLETRLKLFKGYLAYRKLGSLFNKPKPDELNSKVKTLIEEIEDYIPKAKEFYLKVAKSVQRMSERNISIDDILENHTDKILRSVFKTRKEAQEYYENETKMILNIVKIGKEFLNTNKNNLPEAIKEIVNMVPPDEVISKIELSLRDYRSKELDRIYGTKRV